VCSDLFSAVSRASVLVFKFCAARLVFGGKGGIGSSFHVLCPRARFRRYRGRRVSISCFALPDSFLAVPRASGPVFIFCALGVIFGGTEGVGTRFHFLRAQTCFLRSQGRRVSFSYFALPNSFSAVTRASGPIFMFCASGHIFYGTGGVECRFHFLRFRTHFRGYRWHLFKFSCIARPN
jgi:hypothetical protein